MSRRHLIAAEIGESEKHLLKGVQKKKGRSFYSNRRANAKKSGRSLINKERSISKEVDP